MEIITRNLYECISLDRCPINLTFDTKADAGARSITTFFVISAGQLKT